MPSRTLQAIRLVAFALVFTVAGYTAGTWLNRTLAPAPVPDPAGKPVAAATVLPTFTLHDLAGTPRSIDEFSGTPMLINFWATWCAPCLREMPMFETVWQERGGDRRLQIVGIAIDRPDDIATWVEQTGVTYPILQGRADAMEVAGRFGPAFAGLPFTVFITGDRQILLMHSGELTRERLDEILGIVDEVTAGRLSVAAARTRLQPQ